MIASEILFADKPYGISSHQTDTSKPGFVEWLSQRQKRPVLICHRLDKQTTGCFITALNPKTCADINALWAARAVKKKYLFVTDRKPPAQEWTSSSQIEKKGTLWVSLPAAKNDNAATTEFTVRKQEHGFFLIEARPLSGKTHQIRLHAKDSGIPLLGDTLYGGTTYPLHFLHCAEIIFAEHTFSSPPPLIYDHLQWLKKPCLAQWLMSVDRRQRLYPELFKNQQCLRLIHNEGTPLRIDLLGDVAAAGWWSQTPPNQEDLADLTQLMDVLQISKWYLQNHSPQKNSAEKFFVDQAPSTWTATENDLTYEFSKTVGAAPGLFLDQREHRQWLQQNARDKKVLNLFAYTGGFSLNAARGGAQQVTTVDLSAKYIDWSRRNFTLNQIEPTAHAFYAMDSFEYLKYAKKKGLLFDVIICDPPSFSHGKKTRFQIEKDYPTLIEYCLEVLAPQGELLFSSNFEDWSYAQWEDRLGRLKNRQTLEIDRNFSMQWDFEWHSHEASMKSFRVHKK